LAKAPPDGYTVLVQGSNLWLAPFMQDVSYDPVRDFLPHTMAAKSPSILVAHLSVPVKTVKELIAVAKAKPGGLNYASGPAASSPHLGAELFKSMAGVNIVRIAYKGGGPALTGLLSGEVQMMVASAGSVTPHIGSNRLRGLAVTSAEPSALAPGLPTVAASGLPGYELVSPDGIFAPANTRAAIIERLNQEIVRSLNRSDVKEKFFNAGAETVGNSPKEFAAFIKSDMATLGKVIKDAGIKAE
jgi:tripartite-type tricarboxylate transporter receptor subunit TctC